MARPTIVLIPGLMNDGWVWTAQLGPLSRLGAVHIACHHGLDSLGAMAAAILESTAGTLIVAGHSMGGRVGLEIALRAPDRLAGLALLSTGAHGAVASEVVGRERLVGLARAEGMAAVAAAWLPEMVAPATSPTIRAAITAMLCRCAPEAFAAQQRALLNRPDRTSLLPTIVVPTLIATGAEDSWAPPARHEELAAARGDARLAIVEGAGHMLPVEAPAATTDLLCDFVRECIDRGDSNQRDARTPAVK